VRVWNYRITNTIVTSVPPPASGLTIVTQILDRRSGTTAFTFKDT